MVAYFFDTYALIELVKQNPSYLAYAEYPLVTLTLNKIEFCWWALNSHGEEFAQRMLNVLAHAIDPPDSLILEALQFRKEHKKRDLSYADALGYIYAKKHKLIFLTGDKEFKDLPNVRYVK